MYKLCIQFEEIDNIYWFDYNYFYLMDKFICSEENISLMNNIEIVLLV